VLWGSPIRALLERTFGRSVIPHPTSSPSTSPPSSLHVSANIWLALRPCAEAGEALDGPASGRYRAKSGGAGLKKRRIKGVLRPCDEAPRVIERPDSAVSSSFGLRKFPTSAYGGQRWGEPMTAVIPGDRQRKM